MAAIYGPQNDKLVGFQRFHDDDGLLTISLVANYNTDNPNPWKEIIEEGAAVNTIFGSLNLPSKVDNVKVKLWFLP